jgi:hypothetical protein
VQCESLVEEGESAAAVLLAPARCHITHAPLLSCIHTTSHESYPSYTNHPHPSCTNSHIAPHTPHTPYTPHTPHTPLTPVISPLTLLSPFIHPLYSSPFTPVILPHTPSTIHTPLIHLHTPHTPLILIHPSHQLYYLSHGWTAWHTSPGE